MEWFGMVTMWVRNLGWNQLGIYVLVLRDFSYSSSMLPGKFKMASSTSLVVGISWDN
jgi:hypothetical protein